MRNVVTKYRMRETDFFQVPDGIEEIYLLDDNSVVTIGNKCPEKKLPEGIIDGVEWSDVA